MMLLALLLAQASAVDAERAFAAAAQKDGQWTAFRRYAAPDATMFVPSPVKAQDWLKDRADPPRAVQWSPTASFVACDGRMTVNTGEWRRADGSFGYFTTVWVKQADGSWRWMLDHGDTLTAPRRRVARPTVRRASCAGNPPMYGGFETYRWNGVRSGGGHATNATITYAYHSEPTFNRDVRVAIWTGKAWEEVISDHVPSPK